MTVELVSAWAQLIAAIGVIASLFYLAAQVRQNTRSSRALVVDSLARSMHDLAFGIVQNPDLLSVLTDVLPNWEKASDAEKARAYVFLLGYFKLFENAWFQMRQGFLDGEQWQGYDNFLRMVWTLPPVKQWWAMRRNFFSRAFAHYVEQLQPLADVPTFSDVVTGG